MITTIMTTCRTTSLLALLSAILAGFTAAEVAAQTAASPDSAAADSGLQFWAVNEGGARIYRPDAAACSRIGGLSAHYAEAISVKFQVPAYTLKIAGIKLSEGKTGCVLQVDTPAGIRECQLGSVMRTFGGSYLAHTYAQRDDGSVHYVAAACR